jgi:hypothetical protein
MSNRCHCCTLLHAPRCPDARDHRWPLAPLLELVPRSSYRGLMNRLSVSGADVGRAARDGLTDRQADHWAVGLGLHPSLVWPGWDDAGLSALDDVFIHGNGWRQAWLEESAA